MVQKPKKLGNDFFLEKSLSFEFVWHRMQKQ